MSGPRVEPRNRRSLDRYVWLHYISYKGRHEDERRTFPFPGMMTGKYTVTNVLLEGTVYAFGYACDTEYFRKVWWFLIIDLLLFNPIEDDSPKRIQ